MYPPNPPALPPLPNPLEGPYPYADDFGADEEGVYDGVGANESESSLATISTPALAEKSLLGAV